GAVAGRAMGRGGVAHLGQLDGGGGAAVSANLWRQRLGHRDRADPARHVSGACDDVRARAAGIGNDPDAIAITRGGGTPWRRSALSGSAIWDCPWQRTWSRWATRSRASTSMKMLAPGLPPGAA